MYSSSTNEKDNDIQYKAYYELTATIYCVNL